MKNKLMLIIYIGSYIAFMIYAHTGEDAHTHTVESFLKMNPLN